MCDDLSFGLLGFVAIWFCPLVSVANRCSSRKPKVKKPPSGLKW